MKIRNLFWLSCLLSMLAGGSVLASSLLSTPEGGLPPAAIGALSDEVDLGEGVNPDWSPDGRKIAFQALRQGSFSVGTIDVVTHRIEWIEDGAGQAAYPAYMPSGALVYTYGHDTNTAFDAWKSGVRNGYGLRIFEKGCKRDLTYGRFRDYTPVPSPDGKAIYFTTTRWATTYPGNYDMATDLAKVDLATLEISRVVSSPGDNAGVVQPAISPDGRFLVWGRLDVYTRWSSWCIVGARLDQLDRPSELTPPEVTGFAPKWSPDGRLICFTGFTEGDPGWSVYVVNPLTRAVRRVCKGENPCFSPDGRRIAFDRDRRLFIRDVAVDDLSSNQEVIE